MPLIGEFENGKKKNRLFWEPLPCYLSIWLRSQLAAILEGPTKNVWSFLTVPRGLPFFQRLRLDPRRTYYIVDVVVSLYRFSMTDSSSSSVRTASATASEAIHILKLFRPRKSAGLWQGSSVQKRQVPPSVRASRICCVFWPFFVKKSSGGGSRLLLC